jgi:putative transposase
VDWTSFVSGHGFSRAVKVPKKPGFSPCLKMKPLRHAPADAVLSSERTFFVTTKCGTGRHLLQSERNAMLFIEVLRSYVASKKFKVSDFVVMPDHVHMLLTVGPDMTIERAMQYIKGGFSYRLKKETAYAGEVWQRGYSEVRVEDRRSFEEHRRYIAENPVKAGLVASAEMFPFSFIYLAKRKQQGLKPESMRELNGPSKAGP